MRHQGKHYQKRKHNNKRRDISKRSAIVEANQRIGDWESDGGIVGSKSYAASGKYIHKMSNFCNKCRYDPDETLTPKSCPFNALYWDFLARNEAKLKKQQRLAYVYATWQRFTEEKQQGIRKKAVDIKKNLKNSLL